MSPAGGPGPKASPQVPERLALATSSVEETRRLAGALAPLCLPGDVLLVAGDLGAGKTAFAQGFGAGLGITEDITSPTFTLVRQYPVPHGAAGVERFLHADVYRLDHLSEIVDLGLGELVEEGGVALVEWGDVAAPVLGGGSLAVRLEPVPDRDDHRRIGVESVGATWSERWPAVREALEPWRCQP